MIILTDGTEPYPGKVLFLSSGLAGILGRPGQNEVVTGKDLGQPCPTELFVMMEVLYLCCPIWQPEATYDIKYLKYD